jgi:hypothetical protein
MVASSGNHPPSLSALFEAPENMRGEAGIVCGLSADAGFLDIALERFTRLTNEQRSAEGRIRLALVLDSSAPQIMPDSAPGMLHLPLQRVRPRFGLLHAKVALLLFRGSTEAGSQAWVLRLVVGTGNWTFQTVRESIDLFWTIDLGSDDLKAPDRPTRDDAREFVAAWQFFAWILTECCGISTAPSISREDLKALNDLVATISLAGDIASRRGKPRFADNRSASLVNQFMERLVAQPPASKFNYLAIGSGFFSEGKDDKRSEHGALGILEKIHQGLLEGSILTRNAECDLFVNPGNCQGVAATAIALRNLGWRIRPPAYLGEPTNRFLHAKFVFCATASGKNASQCWLYLGSGNITRQGFMTPAASGNLEAGVIFRPGTIQWDPDGGRTNGNPSVRDLLPVQWEDDFTEEDQLDAGKGFEHKEPVFLAPPIPFLRWEQDDAGGWLVPGEPNDLAEGPAVLIDTHGTERHLQDGRFPWPGDQPRQVEVRWNNGWRAIVPVIGSDGRIAALPLPPRRIEELWADLDGFPEPPDIDDDNDPETEDPDDRRKSERRPQQSTDTTLLRSTMILIEKIASRQQSLNQADWPAWCSRLEQTLLRASKTMDVSEFQRLGINPLSPLHQVAFQPAFVQSEGPEQSSYLKALSAVESAWDVGNLRRIGEQQ